MRISNASDEEMRASYRAATQDFVLGVVFTALGAAVLLWAQLTQ